MTMIGEESKAERAIVKIVRTEYIIIEAPRAIFRTLANVVSLIPQTSFSGAFYYSMFLLIIDQNSLSNQ